jgi:steroid delta-isomerase-like uncharacterized protein
MPTTKAAPKSATKELVRGKILALFEAFNAHDVDKLAQMLTSDVVWMDPLSREAYIGKPAVRARLVDLFTTFPDLHFPLEDVATFFADDPKKSVSTWTLMATMEGPTMGFAPTGKAARIKGVCIYEFRGEQIARHTAIFDGMAMGEQLGLLPGEGSLPMKVFTGAQRVTSKVIHLIPRR